MSNLSMEKKLIIVFVFLIILPIMLTGYISYQNYSKSIKKNTSLYASQLTNNITNRLDDYIGDMEQISQIPLYLTPLQQLLEDKSQSLTAKQVEMESYIRIMNNIKRGTNSIYIFDNDNNKYYMIVSGGVRTDLAERSDQWKRLARDAGGKSIFLSTQQVANWQTGKFAFTVIRDIRDFYTQEPIGTIAVDANISVIQNLVRDLETAGNGKVLMIDQNVHVIYDTEQKRMTERISDDPLVKLAAGTSGDFIKEINGIKYLCIYSQSLKTGWKTIIRIPLDQLMKEAMQTQNITLLVTCLVVSFALFVSILLSFALTKPMKRLMRLMKKAENGDLDVSFNVQTRDEAGRLGMHFNSMLERMKELIGQVYYIEGRKKEAELSALQNQINPHFLYNTLETIRMTAEINDDEETAEMIAALGKLFRHSTKSTNGVVTLGQEFEHLETYIQIVNYRYHNKFTLHLEAMQMLHHYPVIPLILQPIVENTVVHGQTEAGNETIDIHISYEISGHILTFHIRDNGVGIRKERLNMLHERLLSGIKPDKEESTTGIGLLNVDERLKLHYGPAYGLELASQEGEGTVVILTLPYNL
ncbi:sensor histidine kinase YesM [Paenibacillus marchantiophytorum]|uniref:histidine kinase n=1 Tax=Paenibacillus marchantiophytorum TaxID=1619310 RepID=A0ABQ1FDL6_9BACL|nr:sensor histidine kinase [Paenibacillus marchantiophytorum]GGA08249.1 sensor histidine kinase YesM [Paenibacillus marchantiophytorum]